MFTPGWAGCALLCVAATSVAHADTRKAEVRKTHIVTVASMQFSPQSLVVRRGDRIVWVNKDLFPHTATADSKVFDSREIVPEASWAYVVEESGDYTYSCTYHPTMKGKITVR